MSSQTYPLTIQGKEKLDAELYHLLHVEKPRIIKAIEVARAHGDLSENADYDAAKQQQGLNEARIADIQSKLARAETIDPSQVQSDCIVFGAICTLKDLNSDKVVTYQIVGEDEADIKLGTISIFSPLAKALIGKNKSDVVEIKTPKGEKDYEIIKFKFK
ncbi:MAG: transcription elongation factor GreA [Bdellovibrionaceae bacterium]|nr:transcription elongation factor GreA [Pseudobdellovibrionaceae bacterium]